ncbi:MAG: hypothetical protein M1832_000914 [Thelocarpon impressellum]|nr:MAG: hypothetical protein M1832_000914 [Thelocarpon impressellum]
MGVYRVELANSNRSGCKDTKCKANGVKITKGELRFATQITVQERTSWTGCVTPRVLDNLKESIENNLDLLDGYDEIPEPEQEKVSRALEQGHVDDEDWKGDVELNRPGQSGAHKRTPKKKKQETEEDGNDETESSPTKTAIKKRGRPKKDDGDQEAPANKKAKPRSKKDKVVDAEEEVQKVEEVEPQASKGATRGKREKKGAGTAADASGDEGDKAAKPKAKAGNRKSRTVPILKEQDDDQAEDVPTAKTTAGPKSRKGAASKKITAEGSAPPKRGRKKAEALPASDVEDAVDDQAEDDPKPNRGGKSRAKQVEGVDGVAAAGPAAKGKGKAGATNGTKKPSKVKATKAS